MDNQQSSSTDSNSPLSSTSTSATTNSNASLPSTSTSDTKKPPQSSTRSREAIKRRNKHRHQKTKVKQQQHTIKRKIYHQWTVVQVKKYLRSLHIPYARIRPIYKSVLILKFNNQNNRDLADARLGIDLFDENTYKKFINNQSS